MQKWASLGAKRRPFLHDHDGSDDVPTTDEGAGPGRRARLARKLRFWASPADQPSWARPVLLLIAALSTVAYSVGAARASVEPFYGAAARSMSQSWHDFVFGAFDPAGTITVDKLPGALWLQALSLRIFGFHIWALVLPQIIEGVITILVLYRAARFIATPVAGLIAAGVLAVSPITVLLNRGNISDSLLIMCLVLAADAATRAIVTSRVLPLIAASVWVGAAFQAKMAQAWLVLPGIWLAYAVAGAPSVRRRLAHIGAAALVTAAVSLSWMSAVSLVPHHDRPFVDGSQHDSVYAQVFDYNGILRFHTGAGGVGQRAPFLVSLLQQGRLLGYGTATVPAGWHRLLTGTLGRDGAWLLPATILSLGLIGWSRRRSGRRDPVRAGAILWGCWLVTTFVAFSAGRYVNSYYVAALSPAVAAIVALGAAEIVRGRFDVRKAAVMAGGIVATTGYAVYLLHRASGVPSWLIPTVAGATCIAVIGLVAVVRLRRRLSVTLTAAFTLLALLLAPATASATSVTRVLGPFDSPFEPHSVTLVTQDLSHNLPQHIASGKRLRALGQPLRLSTETSGLAANDILFSGREILPIGGFTGAVPSPTLSQLQHDVAVGTLKIFVLATSPPTPDPRLEWIRSHCHLSGTAGREGTVTFGQFLCGAASSAAPGPVAGPLPSG
jgi:4-amino-4-deoxy-L-arabinose transferase-like glycosyltransferase